MVNPITQLLSRPKTRPLSNLSQQLVDYDESRPEQYTPQGFTFERPRREIPDPDRGVVDLSRAATKVSEQKAINTAIRRQEAEMARLRSLASQPIDLSGVTPRFSGNNLTAEQRRGNLFAGRPLTDYRVTSEYGPRNSQSGRISSNHGGIDLAAPTGTPIYATHAGYVSVAGWAGGYGNAVYLNGANGLQTRYGHQSRLNVSPGQRVQRGQVIGYVGSTGRSTGSHLHYEIRINGQSINPRRRYSF